ncbi:MAG: RNA ligase [Desulfurococcales archaeon]|nr:RNA ligase [Desulfurococcales archaeon]
MPSEWVIEALTKGLDFSLKRAERLSKTRSIRAMAYGELKYLVLRRDIGRYYEGTAIIKTDTEYKVIPGYPHMKRIVLAKRALNHYFIDKIVVEEKMNGYNVRLFKIGDKIYAATRGGYICPYTTHRIRRKYRENIQHLLSMLGESTIIVGEVVGLENPYIRYKYPEAPQWDIFIFDIFLGKNPLSANERVNLVSDCGLRNVRRLGVIWKHESKKLFEIIDELEKEKREGVVLKDPFYRVEPLKYTTSYINIDDISIGMRSPFDEGRYFVFPRLVRELFMYYERGYDSELIGNKALELGKALINPALNSIKKYVKENGIGETFELRFHNYSFLEDFIEYMFRLDVDFSVISIEKKQSEIIFRGIKWMKETQAQFERILKTGISPMD